MKNDNGQQLSLTQALDLLKIRQGKNFKTADKIIESFCFYDYSNIIMKYDYKSGKKRILNILNSELDVENSNELPCDEKLTFSNAYYSWVTAIFVDIRKSTELFTNENKKDVSRLIRSFTSEIIEIINQGDNLREIGIRGDCVYGIFTTPKKSQINEVFDMACYVNTMIKMLNKLLIKEDIPQIMVGIGVSSAQELVVKAGRKGSGVNNKVWIGDAVTKAANMSGKGNKNHNLPIIISELTYKNLNDHNKGLMSSRKYNDDLDYYYDCDLIISDFNDWINKGMLDNE